MLGCSFCCQLCLSFPLMGCSPNPACFLGLQAWCSTVWLPSEEQGRMQGTQMLFAHQPKSKSLPIRGTWFIPQGCWPGCKLTLISTSSCPSQRSSHNGVSCLANQEGRNQQKKGTLIQRKAARVMCSKNQTASRIPSSITPNTLSCPGTNRPIPVGSWAPVNAL